MTSLKKGKELWLQLHPKPAEPESDTAQDNDPEPSIDWRNPWRERRHPPAWSGGNDAA